MKKKIEFVHSKMTGGHFAFQTENSKKPFINKMTEALMVKLLPSDVVVDIGAYVGEYSLIAARAGVKKVIAYEPTPDSFRLLKKNTKTYKNVLAINAAVSGRTYKSVNLFISSGIGVTNSIAKTNKQKYIAVKAVNYAIAVKGATVVKIDCEGAEYEFNLLQPSLRAIIIEFHPIVHLDWQTAANLTMKQIRKAGFKALVEPKFKNGWDMHAAYVKKK